MAAPVQQKSWTLIVNQRISTLTYTTLLTIGGRWLKLTADSLLAHGYTCKGSSDGTTGTMGGTNRWNTDANASHQGASTVAAQSWMVLTDANGADILLAFVGATGNIARISFSPSGVYVLAGTPTFTPTATDEQVLWSGTDLLTTTLVNDRVLHVWVDSTAKLMRCTTYVSNVQCDATWGVELVNANRTTIPFSPAVWGFAFLAAQFLLNSGSFFAAFSANNRGGYARINGTTINIFTGSESFSGGFVSWNSTNKPELQKGIGNPMFPILIGSTTATRQGPIANLYDWWTIGAGASNGGMQAIYPGGAWVMININTSGVAWPWDNSTLPQTA